MTEEQQIECKCESSVDTQERPCGYRGPRCGYCHGKMEVTRTGEWNDTEGKRVRYMKCVACGLSETFTERRGR